MLELLFALPMALGLYMLGKVTVMGLDDRRSRMTWRPIPIPVTSERSK